MEKLYRQIGDKVVEFTAEEYEQHEIDKAETAINKAKAEAQAQAKASLLAKLGITADEARLLLS